MNLLKSKLRHFKSRATLVTGLLLVAVINIGWGGHHCHRTRSRGRCGIPPEYDYQVVRTSPPARATSATVVLLQGDPTKPAAAVTAAAAPAAGAPTPISPAGVSPAPSAAAAAKPPPKITFYQLTQAEVPKDHCSISRVAVILEQDGQWRVSLQANQNPVQPDGAPKPPPATTATTANQPQKQTSHIKRNEFYVVVRGYGANQLKEASDGKALGKPLLFRFAMDPFWVQNGVPRDMVWDGNSGDVKKFYDLVDRIEVEFSYR
jgi:hypothetical protein